MNPSPSWAHMKFISKDFPSQTFYNFFLLSDCDLSPFSPNNLSHLGQNYFLLPSTNMYSIPYIFLTYLLLFFIITFLSLSIFITLSRILTLRNLSLQWKLSSNQVQTVTAEFCRWQIYQLSKSMFSERPKYPLFLCNNKSKAQTYVYQSKL